MNSHLLTLYFIYMLDVYVCRQFVGVSFHSLNDVICHYFIYVPYLNTLTYYG